VTWADDDAGELAARRKATALAAESSIQRHPAARAVGVNEPAIPGSRLFTVETVGPGWMLWSRTRHVNTDEFAPDPLGGICTEVLHDTVDDPETGERYQRTRYRCLAWWRPEPFQHPTLDTDEIDLGQLAGVDRRACGIAARWLVRPLVIGGTARRSARLAAQLTAREIEALHDAFRLAMAAGL
jgi:hypothetical protein